MHNVPKGSHPGGVAICIFLILLLSFPLPVVVNVAERASPGVPFFLLLNWPVLVGLLQAAGPSAAVGIFKLRKSDMLKTCCLGNLSSAIFQLLLPTKMDLHLLAVTSNHSDFLWWRRRWWVQLLHLCLALCCKCLSHPVFCNLPT